MLTSGKIGVDDRPWRNRYDDSRWPDNWPHWDGLVYDPRPLPESVNPILEAYRENVRAPHPDDTEHGTFAEVTELWAWYLETGSQEVSWDREHLRHAKAVIFRLAHLLGVR